jgi:hypothetical protein
MTRQSENGAMSKRKERLVVSPMSIGIMNPVKTRNLHGGLRGKARVQSKVSQNTI